MKFFKFVVVSAMFVLILNQCGLADNKDECLLLKSTSWTPEEEWKCCWIERRIKSTRDSTWRTSQSCSDQRYDGEIISLTLKQTKAEVKFHGGEIDYNSIDCSSKWIHTFFGLVLLLAFIL